MSTLSIIFHVIGVVLIFFVSFSLGVFITKNQQLERYAMRLKEEMEELQLQGEENLFKHRPTKH